MSEMYGLDTRWITMEAFGDVLPDNWEECAAYLNGIIRDRGILDDAEARADLWDQFCLGELDVKAVGGQ